MRGEERKGKERKGKERKGKERKGKGSGDRLRWQRVDMDIQGDFSRNR